jgi:hypothetical protein
VTTSAEFLSTKVKVNCPERRNAFRLFFNDVLRIDSHTQAALGTMMGELVLGRTRGWRGAAWGAFLGTLPDLDVIALPFPEAAAGMRWHRGLFLFVVVKPQHNREDDSQHPEPNRAGAEIGIDHENKAERKRLPKLQFTPIRECHEADCAKEEAGDQGGGGEHHT